MNISVGQKQVLMALYETDMPSLTAKEIWERLKAKPLTPAFGSIQVYLARLVEQDYVTLHELEAGRYFRMTRAQRERAEKEFGA